MVCAKMLLQKIWLKNLGWDVEVNDKMKKEFLQLVKSLQKLKSIKIPRKIGPITNKSSIHTFCDASANAYACVTYLRNEDTNGIVQVHMLGAKSRISPTTGVTIPRLELLSAGIGARLAASVKKALLKSTEGKVELVTNFWSDSTTALAWITRSLEYATFVYI